MKIWQKPEIYTIAQTKIDAGEMERFVHNNGFPTVEYEQESVFSNSLVNEDLDIIPEWAGRVCYMSFNKGRPSRDYLSHILEVGHGSVLEHGSVTFLIEGISRSLTHELVRHRAGFGFSQLSQRFVDEKDVGFVTPPSIIGNAEAEAEFSKACQESRDRYEALATLLYTSMGDDAKLLEFAIRDGVFRADHTKYLLLDRGDEVLSGSKEYWLEQLGTNPILRKQLEGATARSRKKTVLEAARATLPNSTETKISVTGNMRAWRHFISMRGSIHADREIRRLAVALCKKLKDLAPHTMQDAVVEIAADGLETAILKHPKV